MTKTATITHENITANGWAFLAADVFTRVDAFKADEERQMRECMSNRDNYSAEEIRAVIAHHERNGSSRCADIARVIMAEREAEATAPKTIGIANAKHAYELGTDQGKATVYANTRAQARKDAERAGYTVRDVNMIG